jgi:hypothetical protein
MHADTYPGWAPLARDTRAALALLGHPLPNCLPGEPAACGGSYAEHALAHLAALRAVVEHRISHLGPGSEAMVETIYASTLAALLADDDCGQPGHGVIR